MIMLPHCLQEPMHVECPVDAGKEDGTTIDVKLPLFLPHQILQRLFQAGLKVNSEAIKRYWQHMKRVGHPWALRVQDETMIPKLILRFKLKTFYVFLKPTTATMAHHFKSAYANTPSGSPKSWTWLDHDDVKTESLTLAMHWTKDWSVWRRSQHF